MKPAGIAAAWATCFSSNSGNVKRLPPMPEKPTLIDFFNLRFHQTSNHVLQSANRAMKNGMTEEIILACLLHDTVQELIKVDHGWWGAQLYEPYVSEKVASRSAITRRCVSTRTRRRVTSIRICIATCSARTTSREPYIEANYKFVRNHKWYMEPRMVTVNDLYAFEKA